MRHYHLLPKTFNIKSVIQKIKQVLSKNYSVREEKVEDRVLLIFYNDNEHWMEIFEDRRNIILVFSPEFPKEIRKELLLSVRK